MNVTVKIRHLTTGGRDYVYGDVVDMTDAEIAVLSSYITPVLPTIDVVDKKEADEPTVVALQNDVVSEETVADKQSTAPPIRTRKTRSRKSSA